MWYDITNVLNNKLSLAANIIILNTAVFNIISMWYDITHVLNNKLSLAASIIILNTAVFNIITFVTRLS
jgi:hypothetical protein